MLGNADDCLLLWGPTKSDLFRVDLCLFPLLCRHTMQEMSCQEVQSKSEISTVSTCLKWRNPIFANVQMIQAIRFDKQSRLESKVIPAKAGPTGTGSIAEFWDIHDHLPGQQHGENNHV